MIGRITLTSILIFCVNVLLQGQDIIKDTRHIGLNILSVKYIFENYVPTGYKLPFSCGIVYQKDCNGFTSRYSLNYLRIKNNKELSELDGYYGSDFYTVWSPSAGIQKDLMVISKFSLFYGIEFFSNMSIYKMDYSGGLFGGGFHDKYYHLWFGLSPLLGVQLKIIQKVTISLETCYNLSIRVLNTDNDQALSVGSFQHYLNPINALVIFCNF